MGEERECENGRIGSAERGLQENRSGKTERATGKTGE
jgi:hypothetical protein